MKKPKRQTVSFSEIECSSRKKSADQVRSRKRKFPFKGNEGFPHQAILANTAYGRFAKVSEPVQVYSACHFVTGAIPASDPHIV